MNSRRGIQSDNLPQKQVPTKHYTKTNKDCLYSDKTQKRAKTKSGETIKMETSCIS